MARVVTYASGVELVEVEKHKDERGWAHEFTPSFPVARSLTVLSWYGVIRGMHFQDWRVAPLWKAVRVLEGRIEDFVYDLRREGESSGFVLEEDDGKHLVVPPWCAHGYAVTSPLAVVQYLLSAPRCVEAERVIHYRTLPIAWPAFPRGPILSRKDLEAPPANLVRAGLELPT